MAKLLTAGPGRLLLQTTFRRSYVSATSVRNALIEKEAAKDLEAMPEGKMVSYNWNIC